MFDFEEFIEEIKTHIGDYLEELSIESVEIHQVLKNNGVLETGLVIKQENNNVSPNIYLEHYYMRHKGGFSMDEILMDIASAYRFAMEQIECRDYLPLDEKQVKRNLFIRLVNQAQNETFLCSCPHIPYLDLAITFRYMLISDGERIGSALVRFEDMEHWGFSLEELYEYAMTNMRAMFVPRMVSLQEMLLERMGEWSDINDLCYEYPLYVLTNDIGMNGASCMLYEDILEDFANLIHDSFYILPSSIHEVLLMPEAKAVDVDCLAQTVRDVNRLAVSKIEYLSDSVYYYDFVSKRVSIC